MRSATVPSPRCSAPRPIERPLPTDPAATGSPSCDVTSCARRDSKDNRKCVTFASDVDGCCAMASAAAKKRVRFAPPTDDVTYDVSSQLVPATPPPPSPLPGSSFVRMQTAEPVCQSQLPPARSTSTKLSTFIGLRQDASIV